MEYAFTAEQEAFRSRVRTFIDENWTAPPATARPGDDDTNTAERAYEKRLAANGWLTMAWPKEYGGLAASHMEQTIFREESAYAGAPGGGGQGITMVGPCLMVHGSEEQKKEHLPKIARGEIRWCQGYSEPNAGSDLASLATRAEDKGDHYLINGQKIWTSYADKADWIFCLVRTDNSGSKHEGISFVLFDMASPGVTTRPIKLISGSSPFCETFFDNVKAYKTNLIGEEGKGWAIAKYLLTHEREMISGFGAAAKKSVGQLAVEAMGTDASGRLANGVLRQTIAQYELDTLVFGATMARVGDEAKAGQGLGAASSIFKYYGTELNKRRNELNLAALGEQALGWDGEVYNGGALSRDWLRSKGNSIEGGTSEVQLNIIAKRVLGLPDE